MEGHKKERTGSQYIAARDNFFKAEVMSELVRRGNGLWITDAEARSLVNRAFLRARRSWNRSQTPEIAQAIKNIKVPTPQEE